MIFGGGLTLTNFIQKFFTTWQKKEFFRWQTPQNTYGLRNKTKRNYFALDLIFGEENQNQTNHLTTRRTKKIEPRAKKDEVSES